MQRERQPEGVKRCRSSLDVSRLLDPGLSGDDLFREAVELISFPSAVRTLVLRLHHTTPRDEFEAWVRDVLAVVYPGGQSSSLYQVVRELGYLG
jgi:hypothetical protein